MRLQAGGVGGWKMLLVKPAGANALEGVEPLCSIGSGASDRVSANGFLVRPPGWTERVEYGQRWSLRLACRLLLGCFLTTATQD